ncbi:MAG: hypothetical protein ATN31_09830 [Candidatus Epulonipiscioides saccharophilum]|nr:MAG: hypothetical protein ATN31_09830 [Epulopiscium sp. AS2M-Bin001]
METISEHIFLFPFSWEINPREKYYDFKPQVQIQQSIFKYLNGWRSEAFNIDTIEKYNEFVYFYKPVRNVLYSENAIIIKNYVFEKLDADSVCEIEINHKVYSLKIKKIELKMVKTGIGILLIHLQNFLYNKEDEIRKINTLAQSVYPVSLPINIEKYPARITFKFKDKTISTNTLAINYLRNVSKISAFILEILGTSFITEAVEKQQKILIDSLLGSKMLTVCLIRNNDIYQRKVVNAKDISFGDAQRIYEITTFSIFSYSKSETVSKVYDQMMSLLLMQKASLLSFSNQIAEISILKKIELITGIESLYEIYIQFINQIYFDEVTASEEGAYIYKTVSNIFNIKNDIDQLDFELKEVHEYAELITRQVTNRKMEIMSLIGSALVLPTFVTGFFGMNILDENMLVHWWKYVEVLRWLNAYVVLPMLVVFYFYMRKRTKNIVIYLVQTLLMCSILMCLFCIWRNGTGV